MGLKEMRSHGEKEQKWGNWMGKGLGECDNTEGVKESLLYACHGMNTLVSFA